MVYNRIWIDGLFIVVYDRAKKQLIEYHDTVDINLFFTHLDNFKKIDGRYEYRCLKLNPFGIQLINRFRSEFDGIKFQYSNGKE